MFGIGMGEVFLILLIVLVVYGPERVPGMARKLGILVRDVRRITSEVQRAIENEINRADIPTPPSRADIAKLASPLKESMKEAVKEVFTKND